MTFLKNILIAISNVLKNNLMDLVSILGIVSISTGAFLTGIVTGFYVTGAMLILLAVALFRFGGD